MSTNVYLDKWSNFGKKPLKWEDYTPRTIYDFRKRVRRETLRGKTTVFHESIEDYIVKHLRAYTTFRVFTFWAFALASTRYSNLTF